MPTHRAAIKDSVTAKTVRGSAWLYGRQLVTGGLNLFVIAILARELSPADFGLAALAQVILRFMVILGAAGAGQYVIYDRKEGWEGRVHAAFWFNLTSALLVSAACFAALPLITRFYTQPGLGEILTALTLKYLFDQLSVVPDALIKRSLDYRRLVIRDTVLELLSSVVSVILALTGWGVWSLVIPSLVVSPLRFVMVLVMTRWLPRLAFGLGHWRPIFDYSARVMGAEFVNTVASEGDTLVIGKTLGSEALGIYNMAWQTANVIGRNVVNAVSAVALPALSAVSEDVGRMKKALKRMLRVLGLVSFPLLIGMFVVADEFVSTLYGPQWKPAVIPLQILIIFALRRAVGSPATSVYNAVGRPDLNLKMGLVFVPFYMASIWVGSTHGIVGVAAAVTLVRTVYGVIQFKVIGALVGASLREMHEPFARAFISSCIMGAVVFLTKAVITHSVALSPPTTLAALVAVGAVTYFILLRTLYNDLTKDLLAVLGPLSGTLRVHVGRVLGAA